MTYTNKHHFKINECILLNSENCGISRKYKENSFDNNKSSVSLTVLSAEIAKF